MTQIIPEESSRGGSAAPDPPDLRLRAEMPMANDHAVRARLFLLVHQQELLLVHEERGKGFFNKKHVRRKRINSSRATAV